MSASPRRILVVEDDFLIAQLIEDMLAELGHVLAGSAQGLDVALQMARRGDFDLALVDLQIGGAKTHAVADILIAQGIPFAFATGHAYAEAAPGHPGIPILQKPFSVRDLAAMIERLAPDGGSKRDAP
jgi:CheY-like chemotaxis protein